MSADVPKQDDDDTAEGSGKMTLVPLALIICIAAAVYYLFFVPSPGTRSREAGGSPSVRQAPPSSTAPAAGPATPAAVPAPAAGSAPVIPDRQTQPPGAQTSPGGARVLTTAAFREVGDQGVLVVDFWATWCGPCYKQGPIIETLAQTFSAEPRVVVAKVDVDVEEELADRFDIRQLPTVIVLKDGREVRRFVGVTDERTLARAIRAAL